MKTYRNLAYTLFVLSALSLAFVMFMSTEGLGRVHTALYNVSVSVFSVALVVTIVSVFLYVQSRSVEIVVLRRRASRVYGELLQHKMKIIEVMDGEKPLSDWENFLYNDNEFPRIKRFLYEEYFLLLSYEPFVNSKDTEAVMAFQDMHKELENFIHTVLYDSYELSKFRKEYLKEYGRDIVPATPEEEFTNPDKPLLAEAYEALLQANELSLQNVDSLMKMLDEKLNAMDKRFRTGVPWSETKPGFDMEFRMWMSSMD